MGGAVSETPPPSPQPNIAAEDEALPFGPAFWAVLCFTGNCTGVAAALLMKLLRFVQHASFFYRSGIFLVSRFWSDDHQSAQCSTNVSSRGNASAAGAFDAGRFAAGFAIAEWSAAISPPAA